MQAGHKLSLNLELSIPHLFYPCASVLPLLSTPEALLCCPKNDKPSSPTAWFTPHSLSLLSSELCLWLLLGFTFPGCSSEEPPAPLETCGGPYSHCLPKGLFESRNLGKAELPKAEPFLELWLILRASLHFLNLYQCSTEQGVREKQQT